MAPPRIERKAGRRTRITIPHEGGLVRPCRTATPALKGALDTEIKVDSAPKVSVGTIACTAQKDAEEFGAVNFRLVASAKSAALEWKVSPAWSDFPEQPAKPQRIPQSQTKIMKVLDKFPNGLSFTELQRKSGVNARTFADRVKALVSEQLVDYEEETKLYRKARPQ